MRLVVAAVGKPRNAALAAAISDYELGRRSTGRSTFMKSAKSGLAEQQYRAGSILRGEPYHK